MKKLIYFLAVLGLWFGLLGCGGGGGGDTSIKSGSFDKSFGNKGVVTYKKEAVNNYIVALTIGANNKIYAIGYEDNYLTFYRFSDSGEFEKKFTTSNSVPQCLAYNIIIDKQNKLIIYGLKFKIDDGTYRGFILRLNENLEFDTSFNTNGIKEVDIGEDSLVNSFAIDNDNNYYINLYGRVNHKSVIVKVKPNGDFDTDFAASSLLILDNPIISNIIIDNRLNFLTAEVLSLYHNKYKLNGIYDDNFGVNGKKQIDAVGPVNYVKYKNNFYLMHKNLADDFNIFKYSLNAQRDINFPSFIGLLKNMLNNENFQIKDFKIDKEGKFLVLSKKDSKYYLLKLNNNATKVKEFANNGIKEIEIDFEDYNKPLYIDNNNKILYFKNYEDDTKYFKIFRLNP